MDYYGRSLKSVFKTKHVSTFLYNETNLCFIPCWQSILILAVLESQTYLQQKKKVIQPQSAASLCMTFQTAGYLQTNTKAWMPGKFMQSRLLSKIRAVNSFYLCLIWIKSKESKTTISQQSSNSNNLTKLVIVQFHCSPGMF